MLRENWRHLQPGVLLKAKHQVHILHSLTRSTFYQIINGRHDNHPAGTIVYDKADVTEIAAFNLGEVW